MHDGFLRLHVPRYVLWGVHTVVQVVLSFFGWNWSWCYALCSHIAGSIFHICQAFFLQPWEGRGGEEIARRRQTQSRSRVCDFELVTRTLKPYNAGSASSGWFLDCIFNSEHKTLLVSPFSPEHKAPYTPHKPCKSSATSSQPGTGGDCGPRDLGTLSAQHRPQHNRSPSSGSMAAAAGDGDRT